MACNLGCYILDCLEYSHANGKMCIILAKILHKLKDATGKRRQSSDVVQDSYNALETCRRVKLQLVALVKFVFHFHLYET